LPIPHASFHVCPRFRLRQFHHVRHANRISQHSQRHNEVEQMAYHMAEAVKIWDEAYMGLWNRYGSHGKSGLNITRT
jgi:hypothetical protein